MKKLEMIIFLLSTISTNALIATDNNQFVQLPKKRALENLEEVFVQRWAWFSICDYAYANNFDQGEHPHFNNATPFDPEKVEAGSTIFATAYSIEKFLEEVHPKIKNPYILVTLYYGPVHGISKYVQDPKIIAWFGQSNREAVTFKKFTVIPLGIMRDEHIFEQRKNYNQLFKQLRNKEKTDLLYMNFTVHEGRFDGRGEVYNLFINQPFCTAKKPKPFYEYIHETANFKFVLSPTGDMQDCYRHWEALLVGSIPIVTPTNLDTAFEDLPVLIVNDYKEITEEFLHKKYQEMAGKNYNFRKLYMQYWVDKINEAKLNFFNSK